MLSSLADSINLVILAGAALLIVRLWSTGLYRRYKAFFFYLVFFTLQTVVMMPMDIRGRLYQKVFIVTEPIAWIFYALVALELYSLVLADYRGLYSVGRWVLMAGVALAVVASAVSLMAPYHQRQSRLMSYYLVAERAVYLSLVVFLLTILLLLLQYPIRLSRNAIIHSVVYSFYFLGNTVLFLLLTAGGAPMIQFTRYAIQATSVGALAVWLLMLKPEGEETKVSLRPAWMPGREEVLVSQLTNLNAALLRAAKK